MPNRILRDGILHSELIDRLSYEAEVFYRRLMSIVDDYGRAEAHPKLLLARCFPLRVDRIPLTNVSKWLQECATPDESGRSLCSHYSISGKWYIQINNFGQRTRTASKCPDPPSGQMTAERGQMRANDGLSRARAQSESEAYSETKSNASAEAEETRVLANKPPANAGKIHPLEVENSSVPEEQPPNYAEEFFAALAKRGIGNPDGDPGTQMHLEQLAIAVQGTECPAAVAAAITADLLKTERVRGKPQAYIRKAVVDEINIFRGARKTNAIRPVREALRAIRGAP